MATDVLADTIESVNSAESLADTPFSALFHEARTTTPDNFRTNGYSSVSVGVEITDDGIETGNVVKTRRGEHWRAPDRYDGVVSLTVRPFMETRTARHDIVRQLRDIKQRQVTPSY